MKQFFIEAIKKHNAVITALESRTGKIDMSTPTQLFEEMEVANKLSSLALHLVHEARKYGIDCVACMQSGRITVRAVAQQEQGEAS